MRDFAGTKRFVLLLFITAFALGIVVIVLQTIAWGQQTTLRVYPKYVIEVGRVKLNATNGEIERWKTEGTFAVVNGKDANLYVRYIEASDEFLFCLEATKEHAATDGYMPPMKIRYAAANEIYIEARKE